MTERIDEKDLPLTSAAPTDDLRAVRGGKSVRVPIASLPASPAVQEQIDALAAGQAAGQKVYRTWSELSGVTGSAGVGAQVIDDSGTHTDPVVGGTVSNAGQYVWSASPAGWRWVRPDALPQKADRTELAPLELTAGERFPGMLPASAAANGGVLASVGGKVVGWTIPNGSAGNGTYVTAFIPLSAAEVEYLTGKTIRLRLVGEATAGYLASNPFTTNTVQVVRPGGTTDNAGTSAGTSQNGTTIIREMDYVVTADDIRVGIVNQVSGVSPGTSGNRAFTIKSLSYRVLHGEGAITKNDENLDLLLRALGLDGLPGTVAADRATAAAAAAANSIQSAPITVYRWDAEGLNGASLRTTGNPAVVQGVSIPAGSSGQSSYTSYKVPLADFPAGTRVRLTTDLTTSNNLRSTINGVAVTIRGSQGTGKEVAGTTSATQVSTNRLRLQGEYVVEGSAKEVMGLTLQIGSSNDTSAARYWEHAATYIEVVSAPDVRTKNSLAVAARQSDADGVDYVATVTVAPSGADYSTVTSALNAVVGRGPKKRARVLVNEGVYSTLNGVVPPFTDVIGVGERDRVWLKGELADNVDPATIPNYQTLWVNETSRLVNLKVTCRNMRYAIHSDSGNSNKRAVIETDNCYIEHYGNQGAIDYQTNNGGSPSAVWGAVSALGMGTHSGQKVISRNTWWVARSKAFYFHDTVDWTEDCYIELDGGAVIGTDVGGYSIDVKYLGSMRKTVLRVRPGTILRGPINIDDKTSASAGWLNTALANQPANRMQGEVILDGVGGAGVSWTSTQTNCQALELRGPSGSAGTPFALSGDAAALLFGSQPDYRICTTLPTRTAVYSQFAITSDVNASVGLKTRLGNLTGTPKTLTVAGPVSGSITLDEDYSAMANNAAVISALNAKLTAAGLTTISFNTATPYDERAIVRKPDMEVLAKNTDSGVIARGQGVAINARTGEVKLMTAATTAAEFAGVALEDIPVGGYGRIHKPVRGAQISQSHLVLSGVTAALGMLIGPGSTAGAFSSGGSVGVLRCVETGRTAKPFTVWEFT